MPIVLRKVSSGLVFEDRFNRADGDPGPRYENLTGPGFTWGIVGGQLRPTLNYAEPDSYNSNQRVRLLGLPPLTDLNLSLEFSAEVSHNYSLYLRADAADLASKGFQAWASMAASGLEGFETFGAYILSAAGAPLANAHWDMGTPGGRYFIHDVVQFSVRGRKVRMSVRQRPEDPANYPGAVGTAEYDAPGPADEDYAGAVVIEYNDAGLSVPQGPAGLKWLRVSRGDSITVRGVPAGYSAGLRVLDTLWAGDPAAWLGKPPSVINVTPEVGGVASVDLHGWDTWAPDSAPLLALVIVDADGIIVAAAHLGVGAAGGDGWECQETSDDVVTPPGGTGWRERAADFVGLEDFAGVSTERRPDAVSYDYLSAFTWGPSAVAVTDDGLLNRLWYARDAGGTIYLARENEARDGWDPEVELFTYEGDPIQELDIAFEQNARAIIAAQRNDNELWIYYFDPRAEGGARYAFEPFGEGRCPRCLLDEPNNPEFSSDVLVFYCQESTDRLMFRAQIDRYAVEYPGPLAGVRDTYLEDVFLARENRIGLVYSVRHQGTGRYTLHTLFSALYPIWMQPEGLDGGGSLESLELVLVVIERGIESESVDAFGAVVELNLALPTIPASTEAEEVNAAGAIISLNRALPIVPWTIDPEGVNVAGSIISLSRQLLIIAQTLDPEGVNVNPSIVSLTRETV